MSGGDWVAIVVAVIALVPGVLAYRHQRRKADADAAGVLTGSALELVKAQDAKIKELESHVAKLEQRVKVLETELATVKEEKAAIKDERDAAWRVARRLQGQVESLGQPPVARVPVVQEPA